MQSEQFQVANVSEKTSVKQISPSVFQFCKTIPGFAVIYGQKLKDQANVCVTIRLPEGSQVHQKPIEPKQSQPNLQPQVRLEDPRKNISHEPHCSSDKPCHQESATIAPNSNMLGRLFIGTIVDSFKDKAESYQSITNQKETQAGYGIWLNGQPSEQLPASSVEYIGSRICSVGLKLQLSFDGSSEQVKISGQQGHLKPFTLKSRPDSRIFIGGQRSDVIVTVD